MYYISELRVLHYCYISNRVKVEMRGGERREERERAWTVPAFSS